MRDGLVPCTEAEYDAFLDAYPRLYRSDCATACEPPMLSQYDMTLPGNAEIDAKYGSPQATIERVIAQRQLCSTSPFGGKREPDKFWIRRAT